MQHRRQVILAIAVVLAIGPACVLHASSSKRAPAPLPLKRYLFPDEIPAASQVCVSKDPFDALAAPMSCITIEELRALLRRRRVA